MGMFAARAAKAEASEKQRQYFKPGAYLVDLDVVKFVTADTGVEFFAVEAQVLKSNNQEIQVGSVRSWSVSGAWKGSERDVKAFLCAASGVDADADMSSEDVEALTGKEQPLHGTLMQLECVNRPSTKTGKDFTKHNWEGVNGAIQSQRVALRKAAGLK